MSTGWETRRESLRREAEQYVMAPLRLHGWDVSSTEVEAGEYIVVSAARSGSTRHVALLYTPCTGNDIYRTLAAKVEQILVDGPMSEANRKAYAYGITVPIIAWQDFYDVLVTWNTETSSGKFAPGDHTPKECQVDSTRRLLAEQPIDAIWLRLRQLSSVSLATNLVAARVRKEGVSLTDDEVRSKAEGVAYALRNAIDYFQARNVVTVSQRALNLYYGTMAFAFAEMLAAPTGPKTLAEIENITKYGHGLYTLDGDGRGFGDLIVAAQKNGLFPAWLRFLGIPTDKLPGKKATAAAELAAQDTSWITVEHLFGRIPEIADLYADIFSAPPGWVSPHFDTAANKLPGFRSNGTRPGRSYVTLVDPSTKLTKEDVAAIAGPISEIVEVAPEGGGRQFRVGIDHQQQEHWATPLRVHSSPFAHESLIIPIFGCVDQFRVICFVLLYALSIVVRYRPSIWRRVQEGDLDHMRVLTEAFLAVVERVLPQDFLERVSDQRVFAAQPGSFYA